MRACCTVEPGQTALCPAGQDIRSATCRWNWQHDSDLLEWPGFWRAWECVCAGGRGVQDFVNGVQICECCRHDMLGGNLTSPLDLPQHKIKRIWALINFVFRNLITSLAAVECCCWLMRMAILLFLYSQYGKFNSCHGNSRHKYSFPSLGLCFFSWERFTAYTSPKYCIMDVRAKRPALRFPRLYRYNAAN